MCHRHRPPLNVYATRLFVIANQLERLGMAKTAASLREIANGLSNG